MSVLVSSSQTFLRELARWISVRDLCSLNSPGQRISVGARFRKVADLPLIITLQVLVYSSLVSTYRPNLYISRCRKPIPKYPVRDRGSIKRIIQRSTLGPEAVEIVAHGKRVRCQKHGIGFVVYDSGC